MSAPLLSVLNLQVRYGGIRAVQGISFAVEKGEIVCLIGTNGAGKTSTLKSLARILPPTATMQGGLQLNGKCFENAHAHDMIRKGLALVSEGRGTLTRLTVEENLAMGAYHRNDKTAIAQEIEAIYELMPRLGERRLQLAGTLSGGEQQILVIGRALLGKPDILLLDEPSMGLAPQMIALVFATIRAAHARGLTILLVEQNARMALELSQRAYVMDCGKIVLFGPSAELLNDPRVREVYLGK